MRITLVFTILLASFCLTSCRSVEESDDELVERKNKFLNPTNIEKDAMDCYVNKEIGSCVLYYECEKDTRSRTKRSRDDSRDLSCPHYLEVCCPKKNIIKTAEE